MKFYVYVIKNKINNKVYIGKTSNLKTRWQKHLSAARLNKNAFLIHRAINKHGKENFEFSSIDESDSEFLILKKEEYWINFYKSNIYIHGHLYGYNLTNGGEGISGHKHSDEAKLKMSIASKGIFKSKDHKNSLSLAHMNKTLTKKHKENIGKAISGKKRSKLSKLKYSISKSGENNPSAKLNKIKVIEIKKLLLILTIKEIAKKYKVSNRAILDIKNNKTWINI